MLYGAHAPRRRITPRTDPAREARGGRSVVSRGASAHGDEADVARQARGRRGLRRGDLGRGQGHAAIARRRAARTLAGYLRGVDIADLQQRMANVEQTGNADPRLFHAAEDWRARLIEEGSAAAEKF